MFEEQMAGYFTDSRAGAAAGLDLGKFPGRVDMPDPREELNAAAQIQQGLMTVTMPLLSFATVSGMNLPCAAIGGDFFTAFSDGDAIVIAVADVSGKGIAAAVMASALQGMIHEGLLYKVPLPKIARDANEFFAARDLGAKYATCVIMRVEPDGRLEYLNCGHIQPLVVRRSHAIALSDSCLPIGLFQNAEFRSAKYSLQPDDRVVLVSDGVTDAESPAGSFFGYERLEQCALRGVSAEEIFRSVELFCGERPLCDDCTIMVLHYKGDAQ